MKYTFKLTDSYGFCEKVDVCKSCSQQVLHKSIVRKDVVYYVCSNCQSMSDFALGTGELFLPTARLESSFTPNSPVPMQNISPHMPRPIEFRKPESDRPSVTSTVLKFWEDNPGSKVRAAADYAGINYRHAYSILKGKGLV